MTLCQVLRVTDTAAGTAAAAATPATTTAATAAHAADESCRVSVSPDRSSLRLCERACRQITQLTVITRGSSFLWSFSGVFGLNLKKHPERV